MMDGGWRVRLSMPSIRNRVSYDRFFGKRLPLPKARTRARTRTTTATTATTSPTTSSATPSTTSSTPTSTPSSATTTARNQGRVLLSPCNPARCIPHAIACHVRLANCRSCFVNAPKRVFCTNEHHVAPNCLHIQHEKACLVFMLICSPQ